MFDAGNVRKQDSCILLPSTVFILSLTHVSRIAQIRHPNDSALRMSAYTTKCSFCDHTNCLVFEFSESTATYVQGLEFLLNLHTLAV